MNISLPMPDDVFASNAKEYSLFRQDSWQWGALHAGRLTTARAAACLGFYELDSAKVLKVPRSLSGHSKVLIFAIFFIDFSLLFVSVFYLPFLFANHLNSQKSMIKIYFKFSSIIFDVISMIMCDRLCMHMSTYRNHLPTAGTS